MVSRFLKADSGVALTEALIALPILLALVLGTADLMVMLFDWTRANKATYVGARTAVVTPPVAAGIISFAYDKNPSHIGDFCFDTANGQASADVACPTVSTRCTFGNATCTGGQAFDSDAFNRILGQMQEILPTLTANNIAIDYRTNGLGFYGRPGGLPMQVTIHVRCMRTHFFFLGALMDGIMPQPPADCPQSVGLRGAPIPTFATTLPSEGMGI